jgi:hypothetical protein
VQFLDNVSNSIGGVITRAGIGNAQGIISPACLKDPTDQQWKRSSAPTPVPDASQNRPTRPSADY